MWPILAIAVAIFLTSSTVVTPKQFVAAVAGYSPISVSEAAFSRFWDSAWWLFVKGWHATEFGIVFLAARYMLGRKPMWLAALVSAGLAATDEIHQTFVPSRGGHVSDWCIDVLGIGVFAAIIGFRSVGLRCGWPARVGIRMGLLMCAIPILWFLAVHPFL